MKENNDNSMSRGESLTPLHRSGEVVRSSLSEGVLSGLATLVSSTAGVWYFMKTSPTFVKSTNWQSRTALAIMPPLFIFSLTSEFKINQKMEEMASESEYTKNLHQWHNDNYMKGNKTLSRNDTNSNMMDLYLMNVQNSGVRIVPGDSLDIHHHAANIIQEHPFKLLAVVGVPSVLYIFLGRNQQNLQLQHKLIHTRVIGQGTVIGILVAFMGLKSYMDKWGTFITEAEAERRVQYMNQSRKNFLDRLEQNKHRQDEMKEVMKHAMEEES